MSRWYRAYEGTVNDPKLAEAAMVADVSKAVAVAAWHALLESAASVNNCGSYEITPRRVSIILCEPTPAVEALFAAYSEVGLIEDGVILAWKKRQFESDDSKARVEKHRAKKRQETAENEPGDGDVTACNGDATPPKTETETETEESEAIASVSLRLPVSEAVGFWNTNASAAGWRTVAKLNDGRMRDLRNRLREHGLDGWKAGVIRARASPFLAGADPPPWFTFDFMIHPRKFLKVIEGNYDRTHSDSSDPTSVAIAAVQRQLGGADPGAR